MQGYYCEYCTSIDVQYLLGFIWRQSELYSASIKEA